MDILDGSFKVFKVSKAQTVSHLKNFRTRPNGTSRTIVLRFLRFLRLRNLKNLKTRLNWTSRTGVSRFLRFLEVYRP